MNQKHAGRSRSRGKKMNQPRDPVIVHGTQRSDNESADPPVRNKPQTWKANTLPTRGASINSPKSREGSPSTNLRSSTPKTTTSELNPVLLSRSSSTGSGTKNATTIIATNSPSHNLGLRRSPSDSSGMKDKVMNRSSGLQEHEGSSSTKNQKKTRRSPTSTPSDVESPPEDNDFEDTSDNDSNDTRTEMELPSKKREPKDSRRDLGGQKTKKTSSSSVKSPKRSSAKRNQTRYLDSSSDESDEVDKPDEESPRPYTGSALNKSQYKNLDPNSKDAAIGKSNGNTCLCYALYVNFIQTIVFSF
jgi:hypothetical protein